MANPLLWPKAIILPELGPGKVHVWAWRLEVGESLLARSRALLDGEELARLERFRFARDQDRFAVAHGHLRRILGGYLQLPPSCLQFKSGAYGKPELAGEQADSLRFSLSHTEDLAVVAVAGGQEIGVDLETIHSVEAQVAESFFSPLELAQLGSLSGAAWLASFYRCWTRKEAILKAEGVGLNVPLASFDVSVLPDAVAELVAVRPDACFTQPWKLHHLEPTANTIGALAVAHADEIDCFSFELKD